MCSINNILHDILQKGTWLHGTLLLQAPLHGLLFTLYFVKYTVASILKLNTRTTFSRKSPLNPYPHTRLIKRSFLTAPVISPAVFLFAIISHLTLYLSINISVSPLGCELPEGRDCISFIFEPQWFRLVTGSQLAARIHLLNERISDLINLNILCWCLDCVPVPQKAVISEWFLPEHIRLFHECVCRHISNLSFWTGTIPCSGPPSKNQSLWSVLCNQI